MKIVSVAGTKNTGKTTLVTILVSELVRRGFRVGTVKHTHVKLDLEEKDTWKHREAGAQLVVGAGGEETFFIANESTDLEKIITSVECLKTLDFLILEGYKTAYYAKIATSPLEGALTLAQVDVRELDSSDVADLADLVEEKSFGKLSNMDCKDCGYSGCLEMAKAVVRGEIKEDVCVMKKISDAVLVINGEVVPLNPFVQKFVKNTFLGMVSALKIKDKEIEPEKIELTIQYESNR